KSHFPETVIHVETPGGEGPRRRPWRRIAGGRAPHGTPESSRKTWRREHHRYRDDRETHPGRGGGDVPSPAPRIPNPSGIGTMGGHVDPVVFAPPRVVRWLSCPVRRSTTG